jgi:anti-anti-sigma regulatory factor
MCFDAKHEGNRLVFRFKGKLDTNCINKIYSSVLQSIKEADDIVFDMSEAEYISSLFLNLCMITAREKTMNN